MVLGQARHETHARGGGDEEAPGLGAPQPPGKALLEEESYMAGLQIIISKEKMTPNFQGKLQLDFCWKQDSSVYKVNDMLGYLIKKWKLEIVGARGNCIPSPSK